MRRKLLVLGDAALFDRVADAGPAGCDLIPAPSRADAERALEAHPDLTLVLTTTTNARGALAALKSVRPRLQAVLLTTDRALVRETAGLELGDVASLLAMDTPPAELRASIQAAFERNEQREKAYADVPAGPPKQVHDGTGTWVVNRTGDRVHLHDDWVQVLAHDLRTPLGINNGYANLLLDQFEGMDPEARELLQRMQSNGEWMLGLVDGMLDLAELKHGRVALNRRPVTLTDLVTTAAARMRGLAQPRGVRIEVGRIRDKSAYLVDRLRVEQVLHNLIGNAIKFSPAGSTVRVNARAGKGKLAFTVRDEGPGMSQEEAERVFAKYSSHTGGRGLGLAIAREIVELHGGGIWVETRPERGCTFRFTIAPGAKPDKMPELTAPRRAASRTSE